MKVLQLKPSLLPHQVEFVMCDDVAIQAFVGGYRSGKSEALTWKSLRCAAEIYPGECGVIISPIAGMNQRNIVPILKRILPNTGLIYDEEHLANKYVDYIDIQVGKRTSRIWLNVSAENYTRMNGMSLAWGGFDEADLCRNSEIAYDAFVELGNRLSESDNAMQFAVSTPEGYGFMYKRFVEEASDFTRIWHVDMRDNFLLPKNYLASRLENIPKSKQKAYIEGQFANINTSTVYTDFDRVLNHTNYTVKDNPRGEPLHLGMDFNIDKCASIVHIIKDGLPYAVDEFTKIKDTNAMCSAIRQRYPTQPIYVYPDASGKNRNAIGLGISGVGTAHAILQQAGFKIHVNGVNPLVGDRVNSMNAMFCNAANERRYKVNTTLCPTYTKSLERQAWVKGEPDKSNDVDHPLDAGGYFIHYKFPVQGRATLRTY
jgi:hypothetical protein